MASADVSASVYPERFSAATIYKCLAPCKECTGNYVSEVLQKRFICCCRCHNKIIEDDFGSATQGFKETSV